MSFFKKALRSAGKAVTYPTRKVGLTNKNLSRVGGKLKKVPIVGTSIAATYDVGVASPLRFANNVAKSGRIDRAAYTELKKHVKAAQDLAPVAATVASFFPGVGTGVAGAIGAANALSKGRGITGAFKAGVASAVPGGPAMQGAYNIAKDIGAKKKLSKIQYDTLSRDGVNVTAFQVDAQLAIKGDLKAAARLDAELEKNTKYKQALLSGLTVGYAEQLQDANKVGASSEKSKRTVYQKGKALITGNPILGAINDKRLYQLRLGFPFGVGAMHYKQTPAALAALRKSLTPSLQLGFDAGVAAHIGMATRKPPPGGGSNLQLLGYYITEGLRGSTNKTQKAAILKLLASTEAKSGVAVVVKADKSWWEKVKDWLGL